MLGKKPKHIYCQIIGFLWMGQNRRSEANNYPNDWWRRPRWNKGCGHKPISWNGALFVATEQNEKKKKHLSMLIIFIGSKHLSACHWCGRLLYCRKVQIPATSYMIPTWWQYLTLVKKCTFYPYSIRALILGALCFKFLCKLSNCSRISANFMSHAGWTKLCKKLDLEL